MAVRATGSSWLPALCGIPGERQHAAELMVMARPIAAGEEQICSHVACLPDDALRHLFDAALLALDPLPNEVDGFAACDFTASTAADAVADHEQSEVGIGQKGVLVVGALKADVGMSEVSEPHAGPL